GAYRGREGDRGRRGSGVWTWEPRRRRTRRAGSAVWSAPLERGCALFQEGRGALAHVLGGEGQREVAGFVGQPLVDAAFGAVQHGIENAGGGERGGGRELVGQGVDGLVQLAVLDDPVDDAEFGRTWSLD